MPLCLVAAVAGSGCAVACPAALIEGVLVEADGELAIQVSDGDVRKVNWFDGISVAREGDVLVLKDWFGLRALATEGDRVGVGGGEEGRPGRDPTRWYACGSMAVTGP